MPAVLRRPASYLNEGVADQELMLARLRSDPIPLRKMRPELNYSADVERVLRDRTKGERRNGNRDGDEGHPGSKARPPGLVGTPSVIAPEPACTRNASAWP